MRIAYRQERLVASRGFIGRQLKGIAQYAFAKNDGIPFRSNDPP